MFLLFKFSLPDFSHMCWWTIFITARRLFSMLKILCLRISIVLSWFLHLSFKLKFSLSILSTFSSRSLNFWGFLWENMHPCLNLHSPCASNLHGTGCLSGKRLGLSWQFQLCITLECKSLKMSINPNTDSGGHKWP